VSAIGGSPAKGKTSQLKILNGANNETFKGFYKWLKILNENCYKHFVKLRQKLRYVLISVKRVGV
jgi:hypothetical protein